MKACSTTATAIGLAVDPTDADTVYLPQDGRQNAPFAGRVLVTHDGGKTWSTLPLPDVGYWDAAVTSDGSTVAVLDATGDVHYSTDHGSTWSTTPVASGGGVQRLGFSGHDLYLSTFSALWKIPDLGSGADPVQVWTGPGQYPQVSAFAIRGDGAIAVAGYDATWNQPSVTAVSTDGGATWQDHASPDGKKTLTVLSWVGKDLYVSADIAGLASGLRLGLDAGDRISGLRTNLRPSRRPHPRPGQNYGLYQMRRPRKRHRRQHRRRHR